MQIACSMLYAEYMLDPDSVPGEADLSKLVLKRTSWSLNDLVLSLPETLSQLGSRFSRSNLMVMIEQTEWRVYKTFSVGLRG